MSTTTDVVLNAGEQGMLDRCEATIARGLDTFVEVGEALLEIKERKLWKAYPSFVDYCRERWGMDKSYAYYAIQASETVSTIVETRPDLPPPSSEGVAREVRNAARETDAPARARVTPLLFFNFPFYFRGRDGGVIVTVVTRDAS